MFLTTIIDDSVLIFYRQLTNLVDQQVYDRLRKSFTGTYPSAAAGKHPWWPLSDGRDLTDRFRPHTRLCRVAED